MGETVHINIDGKDIEAEAGASLLKAARQAGIYIPALCSHPDLQSLQTLKPSAMVFRGDEKIVGDAPPSEITGCRLCLVDVEGKGIVTSCTTAAEEGMVVKTDTLPIKEQRAKNLVPLLAKHPHACLTCAQQEGCVREPCSSSVPVPERCCIKFGKCELQKIANFIGVRPETPKYAPQNLPVLRDEPLFVRDFNLCINCARCVRACQDLRGVGALGFVYKDGERIVGTVKAPSPKDSDCRFCGACVEVCPTGALMDRETYTETTRESVLVPCRNACPAGANIPEYVRLASLGRTDEALEVIRERALLPLVLGYICIRPCEDKCRRSQVDEPVSIREIKKHAAKNDSKRWKANVTPRADTDMSVAVIGSGPAGLAAAFLLRLKGHSVAILESEHRLGGVLEWGIPSFRLPREALEEDISEITRDVVIRTGVRVGEDLSMDDILKTFDAVLLATGLPRSRRLAVDGSRLEGVLWGVDFIRAFNAGNPPAVGPKTVVIGGGNVAVDVARAAVRAGAKEVVMACLETRDTMPASPSEIEDALDEGIEVMPSWGPAMVMGDGGNVAGIELKRCTAVFDGSGRFNPVFNEDERTSLVADTVIFAIGQEADLSYLPGDIGIMRGRGGIQVDENLQTTRPGVFAAGDIVKQPGSVVEAIASGRKAASAIDRYLGGDGNVDFVLWSRIPADKKIGPVEGFGKKKRTKGRRRKDRRGDVIRDDAPVEMPLDDREAMAEASRCLQCDLRLGICKNPLPPEKWAPMTGETIAKAPDSEGVYVLRDEKREVIKIAGVQNIRAALIEELAKGKAKYFSFEEDKMYTKKESELLQQHIQQTGKMPGGGEEDELF
jgi:formate dehydrogenase beta subunit